EMREARDIRISRAMSWNGFGKPAIKCGAPQWCVSVVRLSGASGAENSRSHGLPRHATLIPWRRYRHGKSYITERKCHSRPARIIKMPFEDATVGSEPESEESFIFANNGEVDMAEVEDNDNSVSTGPIERITNTLQQLIERFERLQMEVENRKMRPRQRRKAIAFDDQISTDGDTDMESTSVFGSTGASSEIKSIKKTMREYARERLGISPKIPMEDWPVPDPSAVQSYNSKLPHSQGPTEEDLAIDWGTIGRTQWTKDCISIFADDFCARFEAGAFPLLQMDEINRQDIKVFFATYIIGLKRKYKKAMDDPEAAEEEREAANRRSRSSGRQTQLLEHHRFSEDVINMVRDLGPSGMSSEESEGEIGSQGRIFKIKRLQW
ncbi:9151_t:CDS:2, partial [Acaulospora colombiana]